MSATTDLYTLQNHPQQIQDNINRYPNRSRGSFASVDYHQEHRASNVIIGNNLNPSNSLAHLITCKSSDSNESQCSHHLSVQTTGSITTDNENMNPQIPTINHDALDHDIKPNVPLESLHHITSSQIPTSSPHAKPNDRLALSSIISTNDVLPNVTVTNSHFSTDLTLDEDAPHEEDDGATENESTYISLPVGESYPDSNMDSNLQSHHGSTMLHSSAPDQLPSPQTENKPPMPPPIRPACQRKRKHNSIGGANSTKTSAASSQTTRPKSNSRVKTAEQLATEALIEQQNPNATKNELRSLKLRALHAVRIAERELNMPEAEKQRRLRLREYVRQKRAEERSQKNVAGKQANSRRQSSSNTVSGASSRSSSVNNLQVKVEPESCSQDASSATQIKNEANVTSLDNGTQPMTSHQFTAFQGSHSPIQPAPIPNTSTLPLDNACQSELAPSIEQVVSDNLQRQSKPKARKNGQKTPKKRSTSRTTPARALLEAEIKEQHPNASPTELKSLRLRAFHADKIAEREQNMSEKEKLRRHKLRQYMRRRRDEQRAEKAKNDSSDQVNGSVNVCPTPDSHLNYRGSFDSSMNRETPPDPNLHYQGSFGSSMNRDTPLHTNDNSMSGLCAPPGVEEANAKEQFVAFSMDLNHNYHNHFQQPHQAQPHPNLHINPLFHMPMTQSSLDVASPYDCSMQTTYGMPNTAWSPIPATDPEIAGDENAQKALHAAIQEAIYMKSDHNHTLNTGDQHGEHFTTIGEPMESNGLGGGMGYEQVRGDDVLGIMRARELAMIAAAAAEVERAQQIQSSTSSHLH